MVAHLLSHYIKLKEITKRTTILMYQFCGNLFVVPANLIEAMLRAVNSILYENFLFGVRREITRKHIVVVR